MLIPSEELTFFTARAENGALVFTIHKDGSVEFGEGVSPEPAARQFYDYVCGFIKAYGLSGSTPAEAK